MKKYLPLLFLLAAAVAPHAYAQTCTGPGDQASCGAGNVCQQDSNGFYACFPAGQSSGTCTGRNDTSCGSGYSCQQDANGFYACFSNANSASGFTGTGASTLPGTSAGGSATGGSGVTGSGFAQPNLSGLTTLSGTITSFINGILVPLLIAIAFIVFLYGVANAYILNGANEEKRTEGHKFILWAIIGFVVIFSVWGLVNLVQGTLGFSGSEAHPNYPTL